MSSYEALAQSYDNLTNDVDYDTWADYYESLFQKCGLTVRSILDLACGTGTLSCLLARHGYEVIGVDRSVEMLSIAFDKSVDLENRPYFLNQEMQNLDLYGTVDAAICSLDSINYLTDPKDAERTFMRLRHFINPGGLFVFDIRNPQKLAKLDGEMFVDETDREYCVWRAEYDPKTRICNYGMDLFQRSGQVWLRSSEEHFEYAYTCGEIKDMLENSGFENVQFFGDRSFLPPKEEDERFFILCRRKSSGSRASD